MPEWMVGVLHDAAAVENHVPGSTEQIEHANPGPWRSGDCMTATVKRNQRVRRTRAAHDDLSTVGRLDEAPGELEGGCDKQSLEECLNARRPPRARGRLEGTSAGGVEQGSPQVRGGRS